MADNLDGDYLGSMKARELHDIQVQNLINNTIDTLSEHYTNYNVGLILANCHAAMTNKRDEDVMNTIVRDAEYYFVAREGVAKYKWQATKAAAEAFQDMRALWYDQLKDMTGAGTNSKKSISRALESQDHKPNSPAGGSRWAVVGAQDGKLDDPNAVAKPAHCNTSPYQSERDTLNYFGQAGSDTPPN